MSDDALIAETGFWCHYEGMYFSDVTEIIEGHFAYPCGEWGHNGEWLGHKVSPVAIVFLEGDDE